MSAAGPGITVLEASAGTGKTHTVTSVAVEAIAEGLPLEQVLLVTFTRMATGELRDRVWRRLVDVETALAAHLEAGTAPDDDLAADLCAADRDVVAGRHRHLRAAVADFDAATIATIHGFCQQVLSHVGFAGDVERDVDFLEDPRELTAQVVDDLLVQRLHRNADLRFPREEARQIATAVITNPHAVLLPEDASGREGPGMRVRFAQRVRERLERRKRELRVITYDDLLTRLDGTLDGPSGDVVRQRLQDRFRLVVVDEFQDTDTVQWRILRRAFTGGGSPTRLVLVGDPKQAIYAFRGADVHAYLAARRAAGDDRVETLDVNWRSDAGLLQALDAVFGDAALGHEEIRYARTTAAPHHLEPRLVDGLRCEPMRIRQLRRDRDDVVLTDKSGHVKEPWARQTIADDLAADVVRRLTDGSRLVDRAVDGSVRERRRVRPGDIAVLVSRNRDADLVRTALAQVGVPAVVNGTGSVFATEAAGDWLTLLEAVEQPAARTRVRSAVLTSFFGWPADRVPVDDEDAWDRVHERLHVWRDVLARRGVAAMYEQLSATEGLPGRLLGHEGGERRLTDLRHVMELLHGHATEHESGAATLVSWLRQRIRDADDELEGDERRRRLDTDDEAVQVWTVHRSKGLEFPIVHLPFLWKEGWVPEDAPPVYHDEARGDRCIDVGGKRPGWYETWTRYEAEQRGEELRLAYVAMTRAASQVVLWWAPSYNAWRSPLARLLLQPHAEHPLDETPSDDGTRTAFGITASRADGAIALEVAIGRGDARFEPPDHGAADLDVRRWDRVIDERWRRTSYSALTAAAYEETHAHAARIAPEHDDRGIEDERMPEDLPPVGGTGDDGLEARLRAVPSPFGDIGGGARFGTLVHGVLEHADFTAADLGAELRRSLAEQYVGAADLDVGRLVGGLEAAIATPLGPLVGDRALCDVPRTDRLDELHFELPLAGGDEPTGAVTMAAIAEVVQHHLAGDDLLAGYHQHLRGDAMADTFRGYLSGSIDVVLRTGGRFFVVDHKSNWLGVAGEELSAWHYRPEALTTAMVRAHYPLQAMLYAVALHRYLRWRLAGYDPATHLGGVLYLFLRGMCGPDTPRVDGAPCGVFAWQPPAGLVLGLSDLFDAGDAREAVA
jgi:exodeoxyribonuclease V beta subunit